VCVLVHQVRDVGVRESRVSCSKRQETDLLRVPVRRRLKVFRNIEFSWLVDSDVNRVHEGDIDSEGVSGRFYILQGILQGRG
jgi:hypothetical protein